jgi:sarcosine oxidase
MARPLTWDPRHLDTVRAWVRAYLPALDPRPVRAVLCADGYTTDEAGLLGPVPGMDGVVVATGFSGHGFKMASSLGAVAADLIAAGTTATDVSFLSPARFLPPGQQLTDLPLGGAFPGSEPS